MAIPLLPNLHDAELIRMIVTWGEDASDVQLHFDLFDLAPEHGDTARVMATGVREFSFSRSNPWGPSAYVNAAHVSETEHGVALVIEMQSGDELSVTASGIAVD